MATLTNNGGNEFRASVWSLNQDLGNAGLHNFDEWVYVTQAGHRVTFIMWVSDGQFGAYPFDIAYGPANPTDRQPPGSPDDFLRGTVLKSVGDGFVRIRQEADLTRRDVRPSQPGGARPSQESALRLNRAHTRALQTGTPGHPGRSLDRLSPPERPRDPEATGFRPRSRAPS